MPSSESFLILLPVLLQLMMSCTSVASGESTGNDDDDAGSVQKGIMASFSVDSALVPVGAVVELRCRVTRYDGSSFVRLSKSIPGTTRVEHLTTNNMKEDIIRNLDRYSVTADPYGDGGYDFIFTIKDAQVKDSGTYICSVPVLDETKQVEVFVVSEPTSLELYVDGHQIDEHNSSIEYSNLTHINITCVVTGGHPQPVVVLHANNVEIEPTSVQTVCDPQSSDVPAFFPDLSCSATVNVEQFAVDYSTSDKPVTCTARSRGSPDVRLSANFIPRLTGAPPTMKCVRTVISGVYEPSVLMVCHVIPTPPCVVAAPPVMKCARSVMSGVYESSVRLVCHIMSIPPLIDAHISWEGRQHLRPTRREGWPAGVQFDRDDEYMAYLRQGDSEVVFELEFHRVFPQMFRDYTFVATNSVGSSSQTITLVNDPAKGALRHSDACSIHDVTTYFTYVISLAVTSLYWRR